MAKRAKRSGPPPHIKAKNRNPAATQAAPKIMPSADGKEKTVLFIGWSSAIPERLHAAFRGPGWKCVRMDIDKALQPDILGVFTEMKSIADGSVQAIWCPHLLQRFPVHEIEAGLKECYRVLGDGGVMMAVTPDAQIAAAYMANNRPQEAIYTSPAGPVTALDMLYGYGPLLKSGKAHMGHRMGFTGELLGVTLRDAGFTNIRVQRENRELAAIGYKFRFDHPDRVEKVTISVGNTTAEDKNVPVPPVIPASDPGQTASGAPVRYADPLDQPPVIWTKLGLKKSPGK